MNWRLWRDESEKESSAMMASQGRSAWHHPVLSMAPHKPQALQNQNTQNEVVFSTSQQNTNLKTNVHVTQPLFTSTLFTSDQKRCHVVRVAQTGTRSAFRSRLPLRSAAHRSAARAGAAGSGGFDGLRFAAGGQAKNRQSGGEGFAAAAGKVWKCHDGPVEVSWIFDDWKIVNHCERLSESLCQIG